MCILGWEDKYKKLDVKDKGWGDPPLRIRGQIKPEEERALVKG